MRSLLEVIKWFFVVIVSFVVIGLIWQMWNDYQIHTPMIALCNEIKETSDFSTVTQVIKKYEVKRINQVSSESQYPIYHAGDEIKPVKNSKLMIQNWKLTSFAECKLTFENGKVKEKSVGFQF